MTTLSQLIIVCIESGICTLSALFAAVATQQLWLSDTCRTILLLWSHSLKTADLYALGYDKAWIKLRCPDWDGESHFKPQRNVVEIRLCVFFCCSKLIPTTAITTRTTTSVALASLSLSLSPLSLSLSPTHSHLVFLLLVNSDISYHLLCQAKHVYFILRLIVR